MKNKTDYLLTEKMINELHFSHGNGAVNQQVLVNIIEQAGDNIMVTDVEGKILYINPAFEKTTGFTKEEVIGQTPRILQSGRHGKEYYHTLWKTILAGKIFRATTINKNKKGDLYYADQTVTPIRDENGKNIYFVSMWKDITERMKFQETLEGLNKTLEMEKYKLEEILSFDEKVGKIKQLDHLIDFVIQKACDILESKRCSLMLLNDSTGELCIKGAIGLSHRLIKKVKLKIGEGIAGIVAQKGEPLLVEDIDQEKDLERKTRRGYKTKSFMCVPIKFNQKVIGVVNITGKQTKNGTVYTTLDLNILMAIVRQAAVAIENTNMIKELEYLTVTDPMTNLYNYRYFIRALDHEIKRMKRVPRPLTLLMMDIDDFKMYNDQYGHPEGDHLLREISRALCESLREVDIICRYAGDEFSVVLPETSLKNAKFVAEKILEKIKVLKLKKAVTVSMGLALCQENVDRRDLIMKADSALYEAKRKGKNQVVAYN